VSQGLACRASVILCACSAAYARDVGQHRVGQRECRHTTPHRPRTNTPRKHTHTTTHTHNHTHTHTQPHAHAPHAHAPAMSCPASVTTRAKRLSLVPYAMREACSRSAATTVLRSAYLCVCVCVCVCGGCVCARVCVCGQGCGGQLGSGAPAATLTQQAARCQARCTMQRVCGTACVASRRLAGTHQKASFSLGSPTVTRSNRRGTPVPCDSVTSKWRTHTRTHAHTHTHTHHRGPRLAAPGTCGTLESPPWKQHTRTHTHTHTRTHNTTQRTLWRGHGLGHLPLQVPLLLHDEAGAHAEAAPPQQLHAALRVRGCLYHDVVERGARG
jgi:hypothetical protein